MFFVVSGSSLFSLARAKHDTVWLKAKLHHKNGATSPAKSNLFVLIDRPYSTNQQINGHCGTLLLLSTCMSSLPDDHQLGVDREHEHPV